MQLKPYIFSPRSFSRFLAVLLSLAALMEGGRAIEVASSTFGSGTFLLNDSVPYNVVLRGTVPAVITAPNQTPAVEGPFAYIVYAEGTDIYGNLVRIEVARGQARNLRGKVIYDAPPVVEPGPPPVVEDAGPVVVEEATTVTVQGAWTIPNDGTLFNIEDGYKLVVAVFKNPFTPSPPYPPRDLNDGPFPGTFAEFDLQREVQADSGNNIKIDVTPDIAINRPGAIYQAGQYRGKDVIAMATSWRNDNGGLENGRQSRPLRSNYSVDIYSIGLRLTTDPEFGGETPDDFRIYGRGGMAGDLAAYVADGVTQDRRVDVTSTPGPVPAYGIRGSAPRSTLLETIRDYVPQAGDGFLDIGESVTLTTQELVPENYAGRYFVASEVQSGEGLDVNTGNNRFVSNADSKLEILETSSPAIEPVSAVSTQEGNYVKGGNGASDFGSVSEDGGVVAFVSRATDLLDSPSGGGGAVPTSRQQVFLKLTQSREVELISGPRVGLVSADADCFNPEVSANGRYVTYDSAASNILEGEVANGRSMIYVFDRVTRKTVAVSRNNLAKDITSDGVPDITGDLGNGNSFKPSISSSGRFVAFESQATNLDPPKVSASISSSPGPITGMQVLRQGAGYRPASTPAVTISARPGSGSGASATSVVGVNGGVQTVSVSGGGSGYTTNAAPTVTVAPPSQFFPPGAEKGQVFLHDRDTDGNSIFDEAGKTATYLVSAQVLPGGQFKVGDNLSYDPAVSLDDTAAALTANGGVYVAFVSYASNLPDASGYAMVYRAKLDVTAADLNARGLKAVEAVSLNSSGGVPSLTSAEWALGFRPDSYEPSINGNGRHVAFTSWGSNLVYNASTGAYDADTNQVQDVFVRDYEGGAPVTTRVSISEDRVATGWVAFASAPWRNLPMPGGSPSRNIPVNQPVAGDSFEIGDGLQTLKFVFDPAGGPGPDEVAVDIGANIFETRNNLLIAINSAGLRIEAFISTPPSENPPGTAYIAALFLRNKVVGEAGNVPIVTASANGVLYADGMSGGGTQATDAPVAVQGVPFGSSQPSIDRSGRFVAFRTIAENLDVHIRTDANNYAGSPITGELIRPIIWPTANVYVHDRLADGDPLAAFDVPGNYTTRRLSLNKFGYMTYVTGGQQGGVNSVTAANNNSPAISAGGRFVAFSSDSEGIGGLVFGNNNLQPLDTTRFRDVFLVDRRTSSDDPPPISSKPVVTLESPVDGLRVPAGSTISLSATAKPAPGKQISTVQFYINGSPFGAALTSEPYNLSYTLPTGGEYSVRVVATDSKGISSSDSAEITAAPPQGEGPSVAITQPSGANRFVLGSEVILNAFAKDSDGSITAVKFFLNGSPLTATLSDKVPDTYVASFRPSVAGSVVLSATATDGQGNTSVSVPVTLSFVPASSPLPAIEILDFLPGTVLRAGGEIPLRAEVDLAGADEAEVTVQFVANGAVVGTAARQADGTYLLLWKTPVSPGSFTVYARIIAPGASVSTGEDEEGETYFYSALSSNPPLIVNTATGVAPLVRITLPLDGTTAALNQPLTLRAAAGASAGVSAVTVTNQGSGYTNAPTVTFSAPPAGGVTAAAKAVISADKVERVDVTESGSGYTNAPTVTIAPPPAGGVSAQATSTISTPTVASVQFYVNGQHQGAADVNQPYETVFTPVSQGTYVFSAVAIGADGLQSQPDSVVVGINGGVPPVVTVQNPAPDAKYPPGTTIPISATAIPGTPGARIVSMQFFVDGVSLGLPNTQSPFLGEFQVPGEGPFKVVAVATDNFGNVGIGQVNIEGKQQPGAAAAFVNMTHPSNFLTDDFSSPSEFYLNASVSLPANGYVSSVEVTNQGSGYTNAPAVSFSGGGGSGASAIAVLGAGANSNKVVRVQLTDGGSGYTNAPSVTFSGGGGSGAAASASIASYTCTTNDIKFLVDGVQVTGKIQQFGNSFGVRWKSSAEGFFTANAQFTFTNTITTNTIVSPPLRFSIGELNVPLPTIKLLEPGANNNNTIRVGSTTYLQAVVNGGLYAVDQVDFYANQVLIGSVNLPLPLDNQDVLALFPWKTSLVGDFEISARAIQYFDNSVISSERATLKVTGPPSGKEPLVTLLQGPIAEGYYVAGSELFLNATAVAQPPATILTNSIQFFYRGDTINEVRDSRVLAGTNKVYAARVPVETDALSNFSYASAKDSSTNLANSAFRQVNAAAPIRPLPSVVMLEKPPGEPEVTGGFVTLRAQANFPARGGEGAPNDRRVEFYANGAFVGTGAPSAGDPTIYEFRWRTPVAPGAFEINARAVDVNFTQVLIGEEDIDYYSSVVSPLPNPVNTIVGPTPTISVTFPTNGATALVGVPTFIRANATVSGSNLKEVRFYVDGALVGDPDTAFPYEVAYTPASPGLHNIYAVAESISGIIGISTNASVLNVVSGTAPTVSITTPKDGLTTPQTALSIGWSASDSDGSVQRAELLINGAVDPDSIVDRAQDPGSNPGSNVVLFTPPSQGRYVFVVRVTDNLGNVTDSAPVIVTVDNAVVNPLPAVSLTQPLGVSYVAVGSEFYAAASVLPVSPKAINSVSFYLNGRPISAPTGKYGTIYAAPFTVTERKGFLFDTTTLNQLAVGGNELFAEAEDSAGLLNASQVYRIASYGARNPLPAVEMLPLYGGSDTVSVGGKVILQARPIFPTASSTEPVVEFYANGVSIGLGTKNANNDDYSLVWSPAQNGPFIITARAQAVNWTSISVFDEVINGTKVVGSSVSDNFITLNTAAGVKPNVNITAPTAGSNIPINTPVSIKANAVVPPGGQGAIEAVEFYQNGILIGEADTQAPFQVEFAPPSPGIYTLIAVAYGTSGLTGSSPTVQVSAVSGTPPAVSLIRPVATDQFFPGNPITMQAAVTVYGGTTVSKVDFYVNGFPAASDTAPPFEASYTPPAGGPYTIFARATDTIGNVTDSSKVTVTVSDINAGGSDPNQATVLSAYQKLLNRAPTPAENQYWLGMLAGGTPQSTMVMNIMSGAEYNAFQNKLFGFYSKLGVAPVNSTYLTRLDLMKADQSLLTPPANYPALGSNATPAPYGATSGGANAAQEIVGSAAFNAVNPGVQFYGNQDFMLWYFGKWPGYARGDVNALVNAMNAAPQPKGYAVSFINGLVYAANDVSSFDYQLKATSFQWLYFGIWQSPTVPAVSNAAQLQAFIQSRLGEPVSVPAPAPPAAPPAPSAPAPAPVAAQAPAAVSSSSIKRSRIKAPKKPKARPVRKPRARPAQSR